MNLKPTVKDNLFCFDGYQTREIAVMAKNESISDSIINQQESIIENYKILSSANDSIISKQESIIANHWQLEAHHKTLSDKQSKVFELEKEALKTKHLKHKKKLVIVIAILTGLLIVK
jgi:hypothetical protein